MLNILCDFNIYIKLKQCLLGDIKKGNFLQKENFKKKENTHEIRVLSKLSKYFLATDSLTRDVKYYHYTQK